MPKVAAYTLGNEPFWVRGGAAREIPGNAIKREFASRTT